MDTHKYSYSKIDCYNGCGMKFKLQYVDGWYAFTGNISTDLGTCIHETEEAIANDYKANRPIDYKAYKNKIILKLAELEGKYPEDFKALDKTDRTFTQKVYEYLETGIYALEKFMKEHPTYEIVGCEQKFKFTFDDDHYFAGSIDRVFKDTATGELLIQDIKTWPKPEDDDKLTTPLQFVIYTFGASETFGVPVEKIHCEYYLPFCTCSTQTAGTKGFLERGRKKISKLFEEIKAEDWSPTPSALCHWCPYCPTNKNAWFSTKYLCPYFCHYTKDDPKNFLKENEWRGQADHEALLEAYHKQCGINHAQYMIKKN